MTNIGSAENPLRVAIIGAGPAGFYTADHLLKQDNLTASIDIFDRLPTPFGLVRFGVAPDHAKIKAVTKQYDRIAGHPNVRFFGYVALGPDIKVADLRDYYHQIVYCTGAQTDRSLNIPGEDMEGNHPATEFVAWYNGHPDYQDYEFDLSKERVAVVGVGNVAMDVARILAKTPEELVGTDIAGYALAALAESNIKEIYVLGRRGPAQAKFSNPEIKELFELVDTEVLVDAAEIELDPESRADAAANRDTQRKIELLQRFNTSPQTDKSRRLHLRFLVSPTEVLGDDNGEITGLTLVKNGLRRSNRGDMRPYATDQTETLPIDLVFRSIGYRGVPLSGVPFRDDWGVILNDDGRVLDQDTETPLTGEYTAGWIKRGPTGVIGTNRADAGDTVALMMADLAAGIHLQPTHPDPAAALALIRKRQPDYFTYQDWLTLDALEKEKGAARNRPRIKFTDIGDMLAATGKDDE